MWLFYLIMLKYFILKEKNMNKILCQTKNICPSKIVCIGRNYVDHIKELNNDVPEEMVFFIKPNSSISPILQIPQGHASCHYEAEISFLMEEGKISAVGFGLDLTLREVQSRLKKKGLPWERAKAFDGASVFSEFVPFVYQNENLHVRLFIDDVLVQDGSVELMINKPEEIIKEATTFLSFEDGDILMTGTPSGVGELKVGAQFKGQILLDHRVIVEKQWQVN